MAVVSVADTFTRADSPTLGITATGGKTWVRLAGTAGVSGGRASLVGALAVVDAEVQDVSVGANVTSGGFLAFRVQDSSNYWRVRYEAVLVETGRDPIYGQEFEWRADYGGTQTGGHHPSGGAAHTFTTSRTVWGGATDPTPATTLSVSHSHSGGASSIHSLSKLQAYRTGTAPRQTVVGYTTTTRTDHYVYVELVRAGSVTVLDSNLLPASTSSVRVGAVSRRDSSVAVQVNQAEVYSAVGATFLSATRVGIGSVGSASADTFTLTPLNLPPSQPTGLIPNGIGSVNTAAEATFAWQHNDPDPQSRYVLRLRPVGTSVWTTVDNLTASELHRFPVGVLSPGQWEWEVETYDSTGLKSPTSDRASFPAAAPPGLPTIVTPGASAGPVGTSTLRVQFTGAEAFNAYQVRTVLASNPTTVLYDSGTVMGSVGEHVTPFPVNGRSEQVQVRTRSTSSGLFSGYAVRTVSVAYSPPPSPEHVVDPSGPWLRVLIRNGTPGANQPAVVGNELYRRKAGSADPGGVRVAAGLPYDGDWLDAHVGHRADVEYSVVAFGSNGTFQRGPWEPVEPLPAEPDDNTSDVWGTGADSWSSGATEWGDVAPLTGGRYGPSYGPIY